jgi:cytochrome b subunit of formate dehydrogenase
MPKIFRMPLIFLLSFLIITPLALGGASDTCMMCHRNSGMSMARGGKKVSLYVNDVRMKASVHASVDCVNCHVGFSAGSIPHAKVIKPVRCQNCHGIKEYDGSVHGMPSNKSKRDKMPAASCKACHGTHEIASFKDARSAVNRRNVSKSCGQCHRDAYQKYQTSEHYSDFAKTNDPSPSCVNCHGAHHVLSVSDKASPVSRTRESELCLRCHKDGSDIQGQIGSPNAFIDGYRKSVHGIAFASGNTKAATCSDCHGSHDTKKGSDSASRTHKQNIAKTCSLCHAEIAKEYLESIHGAAVQKGSSESPVCTDCHGEHQIDAAKDPSNPVAPKNVSEQVCARCHSSVMLARKYGMPAGRFDSFADSFHGLASKAGSVKAANCASCHGVHNIKPSSDPTSTIHPDKLAATCGNCHPGANKNFARGAVHVVTKKESAGILYWIRTIYIVMIVVIIGGMILHNLLDFLKKARHQLAIRQGRIDREHYSTTQYLRMTLNERIQHGIMLSTFIILAVTGFMLRYPDAWWVLPIWKLNANLFEMRGILHRIAGVLMVGISLYHLGYLFLSKRGRRFAVDMLPRPKDAGDVFKNIGYLSSLSKRKPLFDRFSYIEKAEYWALIWGVIIMAATGIFMWFDNYFIGIFTKFGWDISRTIHFYEAWLATLAILVWHLYFVIYTPGVYPMSTAWYNGKISEEQMAEEHPLELERMRK